MHTSLACGGCQGEYLLMYQFQLKLNSSYTLRGWNCQTRVKQKREREDEKTPGKASARSTVKYSHQRGDSPKVAVNCAAKFTYISDLGPRFSNLLGDFMQNNM